MKIGPFTITILFILTSGMVPAQSPVRTPDKYFVSAHDWALSRIVEATIVDEFDIEIDPNFFLSEMTDFESLDEFEKQKERDRYSAQINKFVQNDVEFWNIIKGFVMEGNLFLGKYDFENGFFPVEKMYLTKNHWSINRGDLNDPAYSYEIGPKLGKSPGGHYISINRPYYYTFDWNFTELNLGFGSSDEAKRFLDSFGRKPLFASISTVKKLSEGDEYKGKPYFAHSFDVQCFILWGNTLRDIKIFPVKDRSTGLCEEFLDVTLSRAATGDVEIPDIWNPENTVDIRKTWNPKWNSVDTSILPFNHQNAWD